MMDEVIEPNQHGVLQLRKARKSGWTKAKRGRFLQVLTETCHVERAVREAGMGPTAAYDLRRRDTKFAAQWQEALAIGYDRLETALLRRALEVIEGLVLEESAQPVEKMTVAQAMDVMSKHRASVERGAARGRRPQARHIATQAETDAVLMKRIAMVERQRARAAGVADSEGGEK